MSIQPIEIFKVNNNTLIVADNIEDAIKIFKEKYQYPYNEVDCIEQVKISSSNTKAYIKHDKIDKNAIYSWIIDNIDRYDKSIGLTAYEFVKELDKFIENK